MGKKVLAERAVCVVPKLTELFAKSLHDEGRGGVKAPGRADSS